ncbi:MAG TPA: SEC-C metal-binding domain-containing protein [Rhabdochlamydiaceae bacterium]|jgi:hypothetical protein
MEKIGRNDPCHCGSGKKYKKCCEMQAKSKRFHAEVVTSASSHPTNGTGKISSLFFRSASSLPSEKPKTSQINITSGAIALKDS